MSGPVSRILSADGSPHLRATVHLENGLPPPAAYPKVAGVRGEASRAGGHGSRPPPRAFPFCLALFFMKTLTLVTRHAGGLLHHLSPHFGHGGVARGSRYVSVAPSAGRPARGYPASHPMESDFPRPCSMRCRAATTRPTQAFNVVNAMVPRSGSRQRLWMGAGFAFGTSTPNGHRAFRALARVSGPSQGLRTLECANSRTLRKVRKPCEAYTRHFPILGRDGGPAARRAGQMLPQPMPGDDLRCARNALGELPGPRHRGLTVIRRGWCVFDSVRARSAQRSWWPAHRRAPAPDLAAGCGR